jgi:scyllo-inositol 2-dehydrogenase (NADP+)
MIDVGLIGFGFAGRAFHAPVIHAVSGMRLAAVLQRSGSEASQRYPDARIVRTLDELLSIDGIRIVVIATPNVTHFDLARQCLAVGKDVVIDKPFATNYEEGIALSRLAKKTGRLLTVYQNRRWDGDFLTVRKLLANETLGRLVLYQSHYDRYRPKLRSSAWRERDHPGSGVLFDLGVHLIDQAMQLFGKPDSVSADIRCERDGAIVDDAFDVVLRYPGMRAVLRASMLACTPGPRFLVRGIAGSYVKFAFDPQEDALKRGEIPSGDSWGREEQDMWGTISTSDGDDIAARPFPTERGDYRGFYENIRDTILGRADLAVTAEQALDVLWAIERARESSARGCVVPWNVSSNAVPMTKE